jgi:uncharacterized protein YndB with AHSA1/START domain
MKSESSARVRVAHGFSASAERVFDAWLDPARAGRWLFATPTGVMTRVEIDARVGGTFRFVDRRNGEDFEHVGTWLELDRPRRLVFEFGVPRFSPDRTRVTVEIEPRGSGCELVLTQEGVLPDFRARTEAGWSMLLDGLDAILAGA